MEPINIERSWLLRGVPPELAAVADVVITTTDELLFLREP
jgi:hypothetical protein